MATTKKTIRGWKWNTIEDFNLAVSSLNESLGIPVSPTAVTQTAMVARPNIVGEDITFYYAGENVQFVPYLGAPTSFDIDVLIPDELPPLT